MDDYIPLKNFAITYPHNNLSDSQGRFESMKQFTIFENWVLVFAAYSYDLDMSLGLSKAPVEWLDFNPLMEMSCTHL